MGETSETSKGFLIANDALKVSFDKKTGGSFGLINLYETFWVCNFLSQSKNFKFGTSIWEGVSGQVFCGKYYGANVALKEIDNIEEFKREHQIIFGKSQMLHPGITKYFYISGICPINSEILSNFQIPTLVDIVS